MSAIRVLHLIASSRGGGAAQVRELALGLPRDRVRAFVVMPEDDGTVSGRDFVEAGVPHVQLAGGNLMAPAAALRVRTLLRRLDIDVLHVHGARAASYGRLAVVGMRDRPRVVFTVHGFAAPFYSWPRRTAYLALERWLQRVTDRTICVARAEAALFRSCDLAPADRIRIVHCGIDVDRFEARSRNAELRSEFRLGSAPVIVTACRLHVPRDFVSLLRAFQAVRDEMPDTRLLIAGEGPQRDRIQEQVHSLGLSTTVRLIGLRHDMPAILALADVFVLTSSGWEGLPVSALEAQAAGVPVVVTDAGGSREAVLDGRTGFVVPKQDPGALAHALLRLLRDASLRAQFGFEGRAHVRATFTGTMMVQQVCAIYEELCR